MESIEKLILSNNLVDCLEIGMAYDTSAVTILFNTKCNLISIDPLASYAYGGINLKVHPNDVEKLQEILNNLNTNLEIV